MIASSRTRKAKKPAAGKPATRKPKPARKDWTSAMPTTPRDTLRMVLPASCTISSPRSLRIRRENILRASTRRGPGENRNPAMMMAAMNSRRPNTTVPEMSSSLLPSGLSFGTTSIRVAFRSVAAIVHSRYTCSPVSRCADDGPGSSGFGGQGNRRELGAEPAHQRLDAADQAESEPGHRADDDHQAQQRDQCCRQPAAAELLRQPVEQWIERDRQDRAPQPDRQEGTDHLQRPICKQAEEGDQDHNVDGRRFERTVSRKFVFFDSHRALAQTPSAPDA